MNTSDYELNLNQYIGKRLRARRTYLGLSQSKLGRYLGVTFQQVQKYENGTNRLSAASLYSISQILAVDVSYFTDGFKPGEKASEACNSTRPSPLKLLHTIERIRKLCVNIVPETEDVKH